MRIPLVLVMLLTFAIATQAQEPASGQNPSPAGAPKSATPQAPKSPSGAQKSSTHAKFADSSFVMKTAQANMAEVELGKMATEKAMRDEVKKFGQMMVDDHTKAGDELKMIAMEKNVTWPTETDSNHKALETKLSKLSGADFDRAYMQAMVDGHKKVAADVRKESTSGSDPDVKAWATKALPTIEGHLKQAESINHAAHPNATAHK